MNINPKKNPNTPIIPLPYRHAATMELFKDKTDTEIWSAFDAGDEMAFNYIYRIHAASLFGFGSQISKDQGMVQDCIQNLFIGLRRKRGSLSEVKSIKAYLFKCLQRDLIRELNKKGGPTYNAEIMEGDSFHIEVSFETKLIQQEQEGEQMAKIQVALNQLTVRQRQAVLLLYEEGMSYKEIAEVMDLNEVKSARKIIYRALDSLRNLLKK
ncbi:RNA polymerase sigma-70 factor, ECF subfamily [Cyclobacterium xiamenense]|uniref:RNA polymerase sigma-70 factor, ECF subfamily n=1 Tax=Cyclobacterium xiamenense TaxID=1297121 RepID=A0A1H7AFI4_9BACT|nr:RNA polymerase sigma factor [Cyclobacterium xiamenense]SEJ60812.1 RNA polymerase sigma-70 factor, ECF subfamily [Cyclobacterium xiamenense]